MDTATKNLENDHVHIIRLIDVMEHITQTENPKVEHLEAIVDIIKNFADGLHHAKEESILFPLLGERGFSSSQGPVAVMLHEHTEGRNFVMGIADGITLLKEGDATALKDIFKNMNGYASLLRNHISKENNILFRMADNALSVADQNTLLTRFAEVEKNHLSTMRSKPYQEQIVDLVNHYKTDV